MKGDRFLLAFKEAVDSVDGKSILEVEPTGIGPGFGSREVLGTVVEVVDERRVYDALKVLGQEQDIADAMIGKSPRLRQVERLCHISSQGALAASKPDLRESLSRSTGHVREGNQRGDNQQENHGALKHDSGDVVAGGSAAEKATSKASRRVFAVYKHRGAQLVLAQTRNRHPWRRDGVFCRADRGEWAGQVSSLHLLDACWERVTQGIKSVTDAMRLLKCPAKKGWHS